MAFSTRVLTHKFINPDQSPGSGTVRMSLLKRMTNGGQTILPGSVSATIAADGSLSITVTPNDDPGTTPTDAQWRVDFDLQYAGATQDSEVITVPSGAGAIDLGSLLPSAEQVQ